MTASAYPPEDHVLRDLRIALDRHGVDHAVSMAPVDDHVRNASGGACLGLIVTLTDVAGAVVARAAAPRGGTATADLAYQSIAPIRDGPALAEARLVRRGSNTIVVGVETYDGQGSDDLTVARPAGAGLMTFRRLPQSASLITIDPKASVDGRSSMARSDSHLSAPLLDRIGLRVLDAATGQIEIANTDYVRNSFGTINGGVMGMAMQGAAEAACGGARRLVATDIQIHYLAQTKAGPLRTVTRVLRVMDDHAVCQVRAVDASRHDPLMAMATVTLQGW